MNIKTITTNIEAATTNTEAATASIRTARPASRLPRRKYKRHDRDEQLVVEAGNRVKAAVNHGPLCVHCGYDRIRKPKSMTVSLRMSWIISQ